MFDADDIEKGTEHLTLGPAYFAARKTAERFMADFASEHFKPLVEEFTKEFRNRLWTNIDDWLLSDTENNLQSMMWRHTDNMVKHVLAGDDWAMKKFALGERYDCECVRKAVAEHIPKELQDARIADLEAEVEELKKAVEYWSRRS